MNIYAIIILSALLVDFAVNLTADILNLATIDNELPEEFGGMYDDDAYRSSQAYTRVNTKIGIFKSGLFLSATLIFWFAGGFNFLDNLVRSCNMTPVVSGVVYISILLLLRTLLSLPFSVFKTFVIEERFGFNRTTPATFIADILKGLVLAVVIGIPLLAGILAFFGYTGSLAWLYCWIATTVFTLLIQYIAPAWIMPIFYKFNPLEEGVLKESITDYARSVNFQISDVYIVDGSRRSGKTNAFFTGFGKNRRIALFDTLVEKHPVKELVAVLAHEIGHHKKHHIMQGTIISILHLGFMFFLLSLFITHEGLFRAFYMDRMSVYAGFIFFGMLYTPVELFLSLLFNILSRSNELQADRFAAETTGSSEMFVSALKKLAVDNLTNLLPHPFYVFLHYSHPPLPQRIRAIRGGPR